MSVDAITPPAATEEAESLRRLCVDFQVTFGTEEGKRVLQYLLNKILYADSVLLRPAIALNQFGSMSAEDSLYMMGCKDAAVKIRKLLNMEFTDDPRPNIVRNRFTSRK